MHLARIGAFKCMPEFLIRIILMVPIKKPGEKISKKYAMVTWGFTNL